MNLIRNIRITLNEEQKKILKKYGITNFAYDQFTLNNEDLFLKIEPYLTEWDAWIIKYASFTDEEILSAQYCIKQGMYTCGYPKPDKDFGYINLRSQACTR